MCWACSAVVYGSFHVFPNYYFLHYLLLSAYLLLNSLLFPYVFMHVSFLCKFFFPDMYSTRIIHLCSCIVRIINLLCYGIFLMNITLPAFCLKC